VICIPRVSKSVEENNVRHMNKLIYSGNSLLSETLRRYSTLEQTVEVLLLSQDLDDEVDNVTRQR
jgi:hypothetical protein